MGSGGGEDGGGALRSFHPQITGTVRAKVSVPGPDVAGREGDGGSKVGLRSAAVGGGATSDPATSPLGLLLLHDLLALLPPPLVDGVARVVDLEGVLVVHVGILDFSGLLVKLQNVSHPKSERGGGEIKERQRSSTKSQPAKRRTKIPYNSKAFWVFFESRRSLK